MNEYEINLSQEVTAQVQIKLKIKSKKSLDEVQSELEEMVAEWSRLARMSPSDIEGYVDGTFSDELNYEGDGGGEISVEVNELETAKKKKAAEVEETSDEESEEEPVSFMKQKFTPSKDLAAILGSEPLGSFDVTKKLMSYLKEHKLLGADKMINADANIMKIAEGKKQLKLAELIQYVNQNLS